MRIGVDIDGVLADSVPLWVSELNSYFDKKKRVEDISILDICRVYEVTADELLKFLLLKGEYLMTGPPPVAGASKYLNLIRKKHEIYIVTARSERFRPQTSDWLQKHGLYFDELLLLGSHDKEEICLEKKLGVMVEDTLEIGIKVSAAGVPVLLMDTPYNQGDLPELIYRRRSWQEIYQSITKGITV